MSYILASTTIRSPERVTVQESSQVAQQRSLSGAISRDYFGSSKRVWVLEYRNVNSAAYSAIKTIYDSYISSSAVVTWEITETNYTVSQTSVHVDLVERQFAVKGDQYLSNFNLVLTEA